MISLFEKISYNMESTFLCSKVPKFLYLNQVMLMDLVNKDKNSGMPAPPVWAIYQTLLDASEEKKVRCY